MAATLGFAEISAYYDEMYVNEIHYREEVERIVGIVNQYMPTAKTILDIACGTGAQAKYLAEYYAVTGLDLSPEMLAIAKAKVPSGQFIVADMCNFSLDVSFDVVANLYGSIGFAENYNAMKSSMKCVYEHLNLGGVFILTPWSTKETFKDGLVAKSRSEKPNGFCRMESVQRISENKVRVQMHHLVANNMDISYHKNESLVSLFSEAEYRSALEEAGFVIAARLSESEFRMGAFICLKLDKH